MMHIILRNMCHTLNKVYPALNLQKCLTSVCISNLNLSMKYNKCPFGLVKINLNPNSILFPKLLACDLTFNSADEDLISKLNWDKQPIFNRFSKWTAPPHTKAQSIYVIFRQNKKFQGISINVICER